MSEHIYNERTGPFTPDENSVDNPGGALMELFMAGRMPDGTPLTDQQVRELGSGLYDLYLASEK